MSERPSILFVDDESAILAGLQNLLYKDRKRWNMTFLPSGDAAAAMLDTEHFDVLVTDMRMPGLDGAALLAMVRDTHPSTARIMLSGHAESEAVMRSLPVVHQLLGKPCAAVVLRDAIERGLALQACPNAAALGRLDLPTPRAIIAELEAALASPTTPALVGIFERDPSLATKALQLVNFHYFGSGAACRSIADAVALLGPERLRYIAQRATPLADPTSAQRLLEIQTAAFTRARFARRAAEPEQREEVFAAELLRDVGDIAILATGIAPETARADLGACLLELWGLPRAIVDAVRG